MTQERVIQFGEYLVRPFSSCQGHPLFRAFFDEPPAGYRFQVQPGPIQPDVRADLAAMSGPSGAALAEIRAAAIAAGATPAAADEFLLSRGGALDFGRQSTLPADTRLVVLPTVPLFCGQAPWILEIEDVATLFWPYISNGATASVDPRHLNSFLPLTALLAHRTCRAIVTHVALTAHCLRRLFPAVAGKVQYVPACSPRRPGFLRPRTPPGPGTEFRVLFCNSWGGGDNFIVRGGIDAVAACARLAPLYPGLRLIVRSSIPGRLPAATLDALGQPWVTVIGGGRIPDREMVELLATAHAYLLPAARLHVASLLEAQAYGIPVIPSDGWGCPEYAPDQVSIPGRYGVTSWEDAETHFLHEDYRSLLAPQPRVIDSLFLALRWLMTDPRGWSRLSDAGTAATASYGPFGIEKWNAGWSRILDSAYAPDAGERRPPAPPTGSDADSAAATAAAESASCKVGSGESYDSPGRVRGGSPVAVEVA